MKHRSDFARPVQEIQNLRIPLSDGVELTARLWMPEDAEQDPVPAIVEYIPYRQHDGTASLDAITHPYYAGHGYAGSAACAGCHGGIQPEEIGQFGPRFERALSDARRALASRLSVEGPCGRAAASVFEHEGTIRFRDASGRILGDCDDDGRMNERWPDASVLSASVRDAAHDLLLIERDGSGGRHNPDFAIRILLAVEAAL